MIDLKTILSAMARTFGISSPEDIRKQKRVAASKSIVPRANSDDQQSHVGPDKPSDDQTATQEAPPQT
jgi:hypothetical protein